MAYSSYERVVAALHHREADRIPFDLGGTMVSGINVNSLRKLKMYLGLPGPVVIRDTITQMADTGADVIERLLVDVENVSPLPPSRSELARDLGLEENHYRLIDEFGMGWQMPRRGGLYHDLYLSPLAGAESVADVKRYPWPDPEDAARYANLKAEADNIVY